MLCQLSQIATTRVLYFQKISATRIRALLGWKLSEESHEVHLVGVDAHQDGRDDHYAVVESAEVPQQLHE